MSNAVENANPDRGAFKTLVILAGVALGALSPFFIFGAASTSSLAEVQDDDYDQALKTVVASRDAVTQGGEPGSPAAAYEKKKCLFPLAQITVFKQRSSDAKKIQIKSGAYLSPSIYVYADEQRIAIPFPAPYPEGRGEITVIGDVEGLSFNISPTWTPTNNGTKTLKVDWAVDRKC